MNAEASGIPMSSSADAWLPAYVGVGSNLENPEVQVARAIEAIGNLPGVRLIVSSSRYRTKPLGEVVQPKFVNAVAGVLTQLTPEDLLGSLLKLERTLGREPPRERWGPRVIDLDLLIVGRETRATATLTLPHAGIAQRDFVLYPLADIAPELDVPGLGRVARLRDVVANRGIEKL
jgi:2-amino-4-hydroxy-6-hydroxymethyldihydropteridine diphosphokinase